MWVRRCEIGVELGVKDNDGRTRPRHVGNENALVLLGDIGVPRQWRNLVGPTNELPLHGNASLLNPTGKQSNCAVPGKPMHHFTFQDLIPSIVRTREDPNRLAEQAVLPAARALPFQGAEPMSPAPTPRMLLKEWPVRGPSLADMDGEVLVPEATQGHGLLTAWTRWYV